MGEHEILGRDNFDKGSSLRIHLFKGDRSDYHSERDPEHCRTIRNCDRCGEEKVSPRALGAAALADIGNHYGCVVDAFPGIDLGGH